MKILLTAFEPFGGRAHNASAEALSALIQRRDELPGLLLESRLLPVEAGRASDELRQALDEIQPDALIALGEAKRDAICLERLGVNQRHFTIPDNAGNLIEDQPVDPAGPPSYFTTLPLEQMLEAMQTTGVPVRLSDDAGRYLCNEILYTALRYAETHDGPGYVGFIHVPHLPSAATSGDYPTLPTQDIVRALQVALLGLAP